MNESNAEERAKEKKNEEKIWSENIKISFVLLILTDSWTSGLHCSMAMCAHG